jgi:hypothetical protein
VDKKEGKSRGKWKGRREKPRWGKVKIGGGGEGNFAGRGRMEEGNIYRKDKRIQA